MRHPSKKNLFGGIFLLNQHLLCCLLYPHRIWPNVNISVMHEYECHVQLCLLCPSVLNLCLQVKVWVLQEKQWKGNTTENLDIEVHSVIDIAVSCNRTWHRRGHTSNYVVGCVIDIFTGIVIHFETISKYRLSCSLTGC